MSNKIDCKGSLRHVFFCLYSPPLLGFGLGWSSNFVGSESGLEYGLQHSHTLSVYSVLLLWERGGVEVNQRGAIVHKAGSKKTT
jgi:hypothetical protein